jgi:hypothetical protein
VSASLDNRVSLLLCLLLTFSRSASKVDIGEANIADILTPARETRPTPLCYLHLLHGGGAVGDAAADAALAARAFGPNLPRLAHLKRRCWDPRNVLSYACPLPRAPMKPKLIVARAMEGTQVDGMEMIREYAIPPWEPRIQVTLEPDRKKASEIITRTTGIIIAQSTQLSYMRPRAIPCYCLERLMLREAHLCIGLEAEEIDHGCRVVRSGSQHSGP